MSRDFDQVPRILQATAVLVVLTLFLISFREALNPFLLFWILVAVLTPFRGTVVHTTLVVLTALLTLLWVLDTTGFLLAPFALALVLAYVLDPTVDRLSAGRLSRSVAILLLALPVVLGVAAVLLVGLPALVRQIIEVLEALPTLVDRVEVLIDRVGGYFGGLDLPFVDEQELLDRVRNADLAALLQERVGGVGLWIWSGALGLGRGIGSFFAIVGYVVLTPVLAFYLLRDWDALVARVRELVPSGHRDWLGDLARDYDRDLSAYLRGQLTVALISGLVTGVGLLVLQFPYALLIGTLVAVLGLIPFVGLVLSLIPAVVIALLSGNAAVGLAQVAGVFAVAQILEQAVVSPKIVGESVGLHPVWIVLALSVGSFFLGFLGLLIGVPLAVAVKLLAVRGLARYRRSELYLGASSD